MVKSSGNTNRRTDLENPPCLRACPPKKSLAAGLRPLHCWFVPLPAAAPSLCRCGCGCCCCCWFIYRQWCDRSESSPRRTWVRDTRTCVSAWACYTKTCICNLQSQTLTDCTRKDELSSTNVDVFLLYYDHTKKILHVNRRSVFPAGTINTFIFRNIRSQDSEGLQCRNWHWHKQGFITRTATLHSVTTLHCTYYTHYCCTILEGIWTTHVLCCPVDLYC